MICYPQDRFLSLGHAVKLSGMVFGEHIRGGVTKTQKSPLEQGGPF